MTKVKICGITDLRDGLKACELGADFLGFVFCRESPRCVDTEHARVMIEDLPREIPKVGIFSNHGLDEVREIANKCHLDILQLHGDEDPAYCDELKKDFRIIKAVRIKSVVSIGEVDRYVNVDYYLLDAYVRGIRGGTGESFDWGVLRGRVFQKPIFLAGGLTPRNVNDAIRKASPFAVDVSSGVEKRPGMKDYRLLKEFIDNAKRS